MLKENLIKLRNAHRLSQEQLAEKIGISRQAYAKWESGATVPDIEKCSALAEVYGVTVDSLIKTETVEGVGCLPPTPRGKSIWGSVTVSDRGQIVIPKAAREKFHIAGGDRLIVLGDEVGIALIQSKSFEAMMEKAIEYASFPLDSEDK